MVVDGKDFSNEKALFCNNDTKNGDAELDIVWMGNQYSLTLHFSVSVVQHQGYVLFHRVYLVLRGHTYFIVSAISF